MPITSAPPLLFLAAQIKDRERAQKVAYEKGERLALALDAAQQALQGLKDSREKLRQSHTQIRKLLGRLIDGQEAERRQTWPHPLTLACGSKHAVA